MKKLKLIFICVMIAFAAKAQQDAHLTHYSFNGLYLNPAYAGIQQAPVFRMTYRNQWLGYQSDFDPNVGAGHTEVISADMPILAVDGGIGINIVNDVLPSMRNSTIQLALSKHVVVGKGKLSVGVQGYIGNQLTGRVGWRPPDGEASILTDEAIPDDTRFSEWMGDMSTGLWYQSDKMNPNKGFYVGASMNRLMESDYKNTTSAEGGTKMHMFVTAGYNIEATYDLTITPHALFKTDFGKTTNDVDQKTRRTHSIEIGAKATYQEAYWGGLNFRQGDAISLLVGGSFMDRKQLKIGYALDIVAFGTAAKAGTSHELMAAYYLPPMVKVPKPIIRTPRYKF